MLGSIAGEAFAVLWSKASVESDWVLHEASYARKGAKTIGQPLRPHPDAYPHHGEFGSDSPGHLC